MTPPDFILLAKAYPEFTIFILVVIIALSGGCILESWWKHYAARRTDAREYRRRVRKAVKYFYRLEDK